MESEKDVSLRDERRAFLAKCVGGIGIGMLGHTPESFAKELKNPPEITKLPLGVEPKFKVITDFNPQQETKLVREDGMIVYALEQLLIEFPENLSDNHWVGMSIIDCAGTSRTQPNRLVPEVRCYGREPEIFDQLGNKFPFEVCELYHNKYFGIWKAFAIAMLPVEVTVPWSDIRLPEGYRPRRLHITPESCHLTFCPVGVEIKNDLVNGIPGNLDLARKESWLSEDTAMAEESDFLQLFPGLPPGLQLGFGFKLPDKSSS